ncbi:MAG: phasin family protein [Candidatus Kentron sp. G]|nr:MAG: phasin family protein [Candidatus Kentron sp. G]VFM97613.1 MAG: phasin family protein [Candidatus Kentron sp. G]
MARKEETISGKDLAVGKAKGNVIKETVSPMEHWKMVAEAAYYRAQERGFIGGDPMGDWMEAEKEVNSKYTVDYSKIMVSLDPSEMMEQFARVFGGVLRHPDFDLNGILENQRKNIEALTAANKLMFEDAREMMTRQMQMFRDAMAQTVSSVTSVSKSKTTRGVADQQAKLIQLGVEKSIASMRDITESITQANAQAFDIADRRIAENMSEFRRFLQKLQG